MKATISVTSSEIAAAYHNASKSRGGGFWNKCSCPHCSNTADANSYPEKNTWYAANVYPVLAETREEASKKNNSLHFA